jgi:hypothetical protein
MTGSDWTALASVAMPIVLAMAPWMFMVHAKLAVIAARVSDLCETIKHANQEQLRLSSVLNCHESRLDALKNRTQIQETNPS